ncbi:acylpyruvase FAHD1, mitochondrial-like [Choloepus didactylus]|uniref:acylpyruvase FAHD1, mitochondrial-like n=1 Tax=Choloepus didactylus TaxID=27675 RepID=UPI00189DEC9A|nr:acylpyruvase FAHD1, mitochondrial-like [Choloepus didactylus]
MHHKLELGMVMGAHDCTVPKAAALDYVVGYTLCLDMTIQDVQDKCKKKGLPWTPAMSVFTPKEKVPDPHNLKLWLKVNGKLQQDGEMSSMIFSIPYIISYVSSIMTLEEGDDILTGRPKEGSPVKENDEIQAGIHGVISMTFKAIISSL